MALQAGIRRSCSTVLRCLPNVLDSHLAFAGGTTKLPIASLRATFGEKYPYEKPFPYEEWPLHYFSFCQDYTEWRFNENTKVVVVDGNIAVGKTEFAKQLAQRFDLKFFPPTREKQLFMLQQSGYNCDARGFDSLLPEGIQSYDLKKFYSDPHPEHGVVGCLQLMWYREKFMDYLLALRHLTNTGQGVVLARSVYSDIVFVDALMRMGWLSENFKEYYTKYRDNSICEVFAPHLHIYLDAPVKVLRERINKRNMPFEVGSRNLTDEYLEAIDYVYKEIYLPEARKKGAVVEVDWTEVGDDVDMDMIAIELQHLKLEGIDKDDPMFGDWARICEDEWTDFRWNVENPHWRDSLFDVPHPWHCDEIMPSSEDMQNLVQFTETHPLFNYKPGWAPEFGHKSYWKFRNPLSYIIAKIPENIDLRKIFTKS